MNPGILSTTGTPQTQLFYQGTRTELKPGDLIRPSHLPDVGARDGMTPYVYLTPDLDAAIWEAKLAVGEGSSRVYIVEPSGQVEDASDLPDYQSP